MNEDLLSFIWRFQYFDASGLRTESGQSVQIVRTGNKNTNAGPDFSDARIRIDDVEWIGSIEIHIKSSAWFTHRHDNDTAYQTVILHVVWENDTPVYRSDQTMLPVIALKGLVKRAILDRYDRLMNHPARNDSSNIVCGEQFSSVSPLLKLSMLDKVLLERLDQKASRVMELWQINHQNWEETAYQWIGQYFGFKLNDPAFLHLTQIIPLKILQKHRDQIVQLEALLFGCAGLLPELPEDPGSEERYIQELRREYRFLANKYQLTSFQMKVHEFKFLRLRPVGFPTIRLSQFASLISRHHSFFAFFTAAESIKDLYAFFNIKQSDYWVTHFQFGKLAATEIPSMGKDAVNLLIINACVPLLVAYSKHRQQPDLLDKALRWLSELPAENNRIIREWKDLEMTVKTAGDSQALIEWYNHYCSDRKCLNCIIGASLVRSV